ARRDFPPSRLPRVPGAPRGRPPREVARCVAPRPRSPASPTPAGRTRSSAAPACACGNATCARFAASHQGAKQSPPPRREPTRRAIGWSDAAWANCRVQRDTCQDRLTARRRGNTTSRRWPPPRAATLTSCRRPEIYQSGGAKNLWAGGGMSSYFSGEHYITSQREGGGEDDDGSVQVWKVRQDGTEGRVLLRRADEEGKLTRDAELTRDGGPPEGWSPLAGRLREGPRCPVALSPDSARGPRGPSAR